MKVVTPTVCLMGKLVCLPTLEGVRYLPFDYLVLGVDYLDVSGETACLARAQGSLVSDFIDVGNEIPRSRNTSGASIEENWEGPRDQPRLNSRV
jgi:hypothetical protein